MTAPPPTDPSRRLRAIEALMRHGPRSLDELGALTSMAPAELEALLQAMPSLVRFVLAGPDGAERSVDMVGLRRALPGGLSARQTSYRVTATGDVQPFADVDFLQGGGTLERQVDGTVTHYSGLAPYMAFAAPSGFLGRQVAHAMADKLGLPENLRDWNDDHRIAYLLGEGLNLPGNLIHGAALLAREAALRLQPATPVDLKVERYIESARHYREASYGSSAGGEQPKFLALVEDAGHVIVKFASRGSRMAQLLPLEHLASQSLAAVGIPVASTQIVMSDEFVFLEVGRFDRSGLTGRIGMLSAGAIDDECFGARDTWSQFAARCVSAGYLGAEDGLRIDVMAAFGELIGNTDRHFENISLLIGDEGEYCGLAPSYDMLPMRYAPLGGGLDPDLTPIEPRVGAIGVSPDVWKPAFEAAVSFWSTVASGSGPWPASDDWRVLAVENLEVVRGFAGPLAQWSGGSGGTQ